MKKIFALLVVTLFGIFSFFTLAYSAKSSTLPPHAKAWGKESSPPPHAKAWGKKYDWKDLTPEERRALKGKEKINKKAGKKTEPIALPDEAKAWGEKYDWQDLTQEEKEALKDEMKINKKGGKKVKPSKSQRGPKKK